MKWIAWQQILPEKLSALIRLADILTAPSPLESTNGDSTYYSLIYHQSVDITADTVETFTFKISNGDLLINVPVEIHIMAADI